MTEAVILAAGEGKRMRPLTARRPKVMLPVAGRPVLEHVVRAARDAGVMRIHLVVHYHAEAVRAHFGDGSSFDVEIHYHEQGEPRGTGHALAALGADARPKEPFLMLSGDTLVEASDLQALRQAAVAANDPPAVVGCVEVPDARPYGALETRDGALVKIHEKSAKPPSNLINAGTYVFHPDIFAAVEGLEPSPRGELELTDAVEALAATGRVPVQRLSTWRDVGRPWDLLASTESLLARLDEKDAFWAIDGTVEPGAVLHGPVRVEEGALVKAGTYIEGPVVIQKGAVVGPMAYLRAYTVVGANAKVGAHTEIKNSLLSSGAKVPHLSYVGDSILGVDVNLGAGTKVANLRHDKGNVHVRQELGGQRIDTGRYKFGVILGDGVKTGINCSLNVGTVVGADALLAPGATYSGTLVGGTTHWGSQRAPDGR